MEIFFFIDITSLFFLFSFFVRLHENSNSIEMHKFFIDYKIEVWEQQNSILSSILFYKESKYCKTHLKTHAEVRNFNSAINTQKNFRFFFFFHLFEMQTNSFDSIKSKCPNFLLKTKIVYLRIGFHMQKKKKRRRRQKKYQNENTQLTEQIEWTTDWCLLVFFVFFSFDSVSVILHVFITFMLMDIELADMFSFFFRCSL